MKNKELLKKLGKLGFPLFEVDDESFANETISELVKSNNVRLWEGFPVIFANANRENLFDFDKMKKLLKNKDDYQKYLTLLLISLSLYKILNIKFRWVDNLYNNLNLKDKNKINNFVKRFNNNNEFIIAQKQLDPQRIKVTFDNYFRQQETEIKKIESNYEELSLEYAMSQIFTSKQKEIFLKRIQGKKLTKTEREYFYRVVKKKAIAIVNPDLQKLARRVIG